MQTKNVGGPDAPRRSTLDVFLNRLLERGFTGPVCFIFGVSLIGIGLGDAREGRLTTKAFGDGSHGTIESLTVLLHSPSILDRIVIALPWAFIGLCVCGFAWDLTRMVRPGADGRRFPPLPLRRTFVASVLGVVATLVGFVVQLVPGMYFKGDGIQVVMGPWTPAIFLCIVTAVHTLSTHFVELGNRADDEVEGLI